MSLPIVIIDYRLPKEALQTLQNYAETCIFNAEGLTFEAVNGHPDIFACQIDNQLIIAPNTPQNCINILKKKQIKFLFGEQEIGFNIKTSTQYNCVVTNDLILHKEGFTDIKILELCTNKRFINLPQSFTRCSLFVFGQKYFITSDKGIYKILVANNFDILFVEPTDILLPPYKNGFIGGCLGVEGNRVYLSGSIAHLKDGILLKNYIEQCGYKLIELYDGRVLDVGGLLFI